MVLGTLCLNVCFSTSMPGISAGCDVDSMNISLILVYIYIYVCVF